MNLESPLAPTSPNLADSGSTGLAAPFDIGKVVGSGPLTQAGIPESMTGESAQSGTLPSTTGAAWGKLLSWLGVPSVNDVIGMILGLLLVAAGIFLFKPVREAATTAVKTAVVA